MATKVNSNKTHCLADTHSAQREKFDALATDPGEINFSHYDDETQFGPWSPYWTAFSLIAESACQGNRLLVIGSGMGRDALIYAKLGYQVDGIDISPKCVEISNTLACKYNLADKAKFHVQPAEQLEFEDDTFDKAVGINVLHHVDTQECSSELHRVLKTGGSAIFKEPRRTPVRDIFRNAPPVTWLVPKGVKNRVTGSKQAELAPGERLLDSSDFEILQKTFGNLKVTRFHVLAKMSAIFSRRSMWERFDHRMFRWLPFTRVAGDQMVLEMTKE